VGVAAEHDAAPEPVVGDRAEEAVARSGISIPGIGREAPPAVDVDPGARHQRLLRDEVPALGDGAQAVGEPALLVRSEHGPAGGRQAAAALVDLVGAAAARGRTGLRRAQLAAVEHVEAREPAPVMPGAQHHAAVLRARALAQRHMLEVRRVGGGAAAPEVRVQRVRSRPRVVVVDLVVVPGHEPGNGGVQILQVGVRLVLGVPIAVLRERSCLGAGVAAHPAGVPAALVDVVAHEHHEVEALGRQMAVGGEEAVLEVLTRPQSEPQPPGKARHRGRRTRSTHRADLVTRDEPVEVPALGLEALHLDVHAVRRPRRQRGDGSALRDPREPLVLGHLPAHDHLVGAHAAAVERFRRQARPQNDARRQR